VELNELNAHIVHEFGPDRFWQPEGGGFTRVAPSEYHLLPDNLPQTKTVIQTHPLTPYYGRKYARGSWPEIAAILEFLRRRVLNAEVWYGPDSSDEVERVTPEWLDAMWQHWAEKGTRDYYKK